MPPRLSQVRRAGRSRWRHSGLLENSHRTDVWPDSVQVPVGFALYWAAHPSTGVARYRSAARTGLSPSIPPAFRRVWVLGGDVDQQGGVAGQVPAQPCGSLLGIGIGIGIGIGRGWLAYRPIAARVRRLQTSTTPRM